MGVTARLPLPRRLKTAAILTVVCLTLGFLVSYAATRLRWQGAYSMTLHLQALTQFERPGNFPLRLFWLGSLFAGSCCSLGALVYRGSGRAVPDLHGSARWAGWPEICRAGLLGAGLYVGGYRRRNRLYHLRDDGETHLLTFAPTRSGKGVSIILPTLLTNEDKSFFVFDIKGENYALSSRWREKAGNRIVKLEPAGAESHRYNPLDEIVWGSPTAIKDIQNLATILTDSGKKARDSHWEDKAREALTGLIIYTLEDPDRERTLHAVGSLLTDPERDQEETLEQLVEDCEHAEARKHLASLRHTPEKERGSIISTLHKTFELFADPLIRQNTAESDFSLDELVDGPAPMTMYFVVQPNDLDRLSSLCRIFITQLLNRLVHGMTFEGGRAQRRRRHSLVLMLDEFAAMKNLPAFESSLAFIAGYGVRAHLIVQDLDQIIKHYGRENGILGNCSIRIAFAPNTNVTADYLSKELGNQTVVREKISTSGREWSLKDSRSSSMDEVSRPLLTPDEARRLKPIAVDGGEEPGGECLIMREGHYPIRGTRVLFFQNPVFLARSRMEPAKIVHQE